MKRRIITIFLTAVMIITSAAPMSFASSKTVKMTAYEVLKSGNTVYCPAPGDGIYKVTVKNGKVKKVKWLIKSEFAMGDYSYIGGLKKKGNYLYFIAGSEGTYSSLCRVNLKTRKQKVVAEYGTDYAFKKNRIYVAMFEAGDEEDYVYYRSMKLDGSAKKKTSVRPKTTYKMSNAKGYSVIYKEKGNYVYTYLKTPKGKFKLGKIKLDY